MRQYLDLLRHIQTNGSVRGDRTGTGTRSVFGHQMRFDLSNNNFPLLTTKKLFLRGIIHELLWFLQGDTNNEALAALDVHIWDGWALEEDYSVQVPLSLTDRCRLLAEKLEISRGDAADLLIAADRQWAIDHAEEIAETHPGQVDESAGGKALLDEHGIPVSVQKLKVRKGELGPIYGNQWRSWKIIDADGEIRTIDQIGEVIHNLKTKPFSRRHVVTAWNPADLPDESLSPQENVKLGKQALASCHCLFQFYVDTLTREERVALWAQRDAEFPGDVAVSKMSEEQIDIFLGHSNIPSQKLSCQLYQRSCDVFLGVPFNIASYALLTAMVAQVCGMVPHEFIWTGGDVHVYSNHVDQVNLQLTREPNEGPKLFINPDVSNINDFQINDFEIRDYNPHPAIKAKVSV